MGATSVSLLLFYRRAQKPFAVLPFPEEYRVGNVYSMIVFGLDIGEFEYAYSIDGPNDPARGMLFDPNNIILDPYARAVAGQSKWGTKAIPGSYRGRIVSSYFNWENVQSPHIPMQDLVIYEMHVRGFSLNTNRPASPIRAPLTASLKRLRISKTSVSMPWS